MTANELKLSLHKAIDSVSDAPVLLALNNAVTKILKEKKNRIVGYDADMKPITRQQLEDEVVAASERVKAGQLISHEEVLKQMENW